MWIYFVINSSLAIGIGDPVASVGRLALSFTDRRNSSQARQTPPVGRSEKARRHSPELQWSPNTNTGDLRYHCMENEL